MATLHVQHGEVLTDDAINLAVSLPQGVYEVGTPTISATAGGWNVMIPVGPAGFSLWRDAGSVTHGRQAIFETGSIGPFFVASPSAGDLSGGLSRIDLILGARHWAASSPLGTMTAEMAPYYGTLAGASAATPAAAALPAVFPSGWVAPAAGGIPVPLFQVSVPPSGTPTVSVYPASDCRIANLGALLAEVQAARLTYGSLAARIAAITLTGGPTGPTGATGATGATGETGAPGATGATGNPGVPGGICVQVSGIGTWTSGSIQVAGNTGSPTFDSGSSGIKINTTGFYRIVMNAVSANNSSGSAQNQIINLLRNGSQIMQDSSVIGTGQSNIPLQAITEMIALTAGDIITRNTTGSWAIPTSLVVDLIMI